MKRRIEAAAAVLAGVIALGCEQPPPSAPTLTGPLFEAATTTDITTTTTLTITDAGKQWVSGGGIAHTRDQTQSGTVSGDLTGTTTVMGRSDVEVATMDGTASGEFTITVTAPAVGTFEGSCSPEKPAQTGIAASVADTSMSNGRVLPFFRVDCTRLIQVLGRSIDSRVLGRALARVIAHELYHIVARTADHQDSGVAKAVFSAQDLTDIRFEFDSASISRMQLSPLAGFSDISAITER